MLCNNYISVGLNDGEKQKPVHHSLHCSHNKFYLVLSRLVIVVFLCMYELSFFNELLFILYFYILTESSPFTSLYIERRNNMTHFHSQDWNSKFGSRLFRLLSILNGLKPNSLRLTNLFIDFQAIIK